MAEQQLVDYIKKAREAGQTDDQTTNLLYKNGWTEAEVKDAFSFMGQSNVQQVKPQPVAQPAKSPEGQLGGQATMPQAQAQPQVQPKTVSQPESFKNPRSHLAIKLVMVLIIVIALGGIGYFVAGQYFLSPNPETVISKMMANMKEVKSASSITKGEISTEINGGNKVSMFFNADTDSDITDSANAKVQSAFSVELTASTGRGLIDANTIIINNDIYLKLNDITMPADTLAPGLDVSLVKDKWLKIDQESIIALAEMQGGSIDMLPSLSEVNNSELNKKIQDLLVSENIYSEVKKLKGEKISGQNTFHYLATIDKEKLNGLIMKIIDLQMQEAENLNDTNPEINSAIVKNMAQAMLKTFLDEIGDITVELWIGKKDYMLHATKFEKTIDISKLYPAIKAKMTLKFDVTNSDFNKPIIIETPTGSEKIENVIMPLLSGQYLPTEEKSIVGSKMAQIRALVDDAYSDNNAYSSICNRGLLNGYLDIYGPELIELNNEIVAQGAKKPSCFANASEYCISTQLSDGSYLCINKDRVGVEKCVSAQTACSR